MEIWQALYVSCIPFVVLALVCGVTAADAWRHKSRWVIAAMTNTSIAAVLFLAATWTGIGS